MSRRRRNSTASAFSLFAFQDIITSVTGVMIMITLLLAVELVNRVERSPAVQTVVQSANLANSIETLQRQIRDAERQLERSSQSVTDLPAVDAATLSEELQELERRRASVSQELEASETSLRARMTALEEATKANRQDAAGEIDQLTRLRKETEELTKSLAAVKASDRVLFRNGVKDKETWIVEVAASTIRAGKIGEREPPISFGSFTRFEQWLRRQSEQRVAFYLIVKPPRAAERFDALRETIMAENFDVGYTLVGPQQVVLDEQVGAGVP